MQAKFDTISVVENLEPSDIKNSSVHFFNAKFYENYIFKILYYKSAKKLIMNDYDE